MYYYTQNFTHRIFEYFIYYKYDVLYALVKHWNKLTIWENCMGNHLRGYSMAKRRDQVVQPDAKCVF